MKRVALGIRFALALVGLAAVAHPARAQAWPERPVTMIIPFAPGGGTDVLARIIAPVLGPKLGASIVIETVAGGAGNLGSQRLARSAPDGYTLLMHNVGFAINAGLYKSLPFDSEKDVAALAFVSDSPLVILGRKSLPAENLKDLLAWMKKTPAKLAHAGVGSASHMAIVPLQRAAGQGDMVPYRGGGPAVQDVIGGHVDLTASPLQSAIGPAREGLARAFAVTTAERSPALPEVPSIASELGPRSTTSFWSVLMARSGTPAAITAKLLAALEETLSDPQIRQSYEKNGLTLFPVEQRRPEGAQAYLLKEIAHWREIVKESNIEAP